MAVMHRAESRIGSAISDEADIGHSRTDCSCVCELENPPRPAGHQGVNHMMNKDSDPCVTTMSDTRMHAIM